MPYAAPRGKQINKKLQRKIYEYHNKLCSIIEYMNYPYLSTGSNRLQATTTLIITNKSQNCNTTLRLAHSSHYT